MIRLQTACTDTAHHQTYYYRSYYNYYLLITITRIVTVRKQRIRCSVPITVFIVFKYYDKVDTTRYDLIRFQTFITHWRVLQYHKNQSLRIALNEGF